MLPFDDKQTRVAFSDVRYCSCWGCIVPLNTRYRTDDLAYTVAQSESASLIALAESGPINYQEMLAKSIDDISYL